MMLDVICFGEILWDIFEARPRGSDPIARTFRRELGGAPANVATGLARLGVRAAVVGGVGRDRFGDALVAHLRQDHVDVRFVLKLPNRTGLAFVTPGARGEPAFLFYRHESADISLRAEHIAPAMGRARWVLVGTSTLMTRELERTCWSISTCDRTSGRTSGRCKGPSPALPSALTWSKPAMRTSKP
jgi:fructokinase